MLKVKSIKFFLGLSYLSILLIFLWYLFNNFSLSEITSYDFIKKNRDFLIGFRESNFLITILIFTFLTIIWVVLLGLGSPVALLGGFIFGKWLGTIIVVVSLTCGCTLLYIFASFFLKNLIKKNFEKKYFYLNNKIKKNEFMYFFIYRFIGGIPFFIANIFPVMFNIKLKNYFFGSMLGMTPQLFIIVSLGAGLEKIIDENLSKPSFFQLISSQEVYIPILSFLVLLILIFFIKKKI